MSVCELLQNFSPYNCSIPAVRAVNRKNKVLAVAWRVCTGCSMIKRSISYDTRLQNLQHNDFRDKSCGPASWGAPAADYCVNDAPTSVPMQIHSTQTHSKQTGTWAGSWTQAPLRTTSETILADAAQSAAQIQFNITARFKTALIKKDKDFAGGPLILLRPKLYAWLVPLESINSLLWVESHFLFKNEWINRPAAPKTVRLKKVELKRTPTLPAFMRSIYFFRFTWSVVLPSSWGLIPGLSKSVNMPTSGWESVMRDGYKYSTARNTHACYN